MDSFNQQDFSNYTVVGSRQATGSGTVAKKFMASVFLWMFIALGISTFFAVLYASSPSLTSELFETTAQGVHPTVFWYIASFSPLAFVLIMGGAYNRFSANTLTLLFLAFAAMMGISLSTILLIFAPGSILGCFASASAMFGVMAVMGYTTDKDLTSFGRILFMGLIGVVISSVINMFIGSSGFDFIISILGVAIFTGLTAYDVQKLKRIGAGIEYGGGYTGDVRKMAIMGAMSIYLDFVNLFLMLLRLFGNRRN